MTKLIHTEHTLRQLAEAQAKHAAKCNRIIAECVICRDHFKLVRGG